MVKKSKKTIEEAREIAQEIEYTKQASAALIDSIIGIFILTVILEIIAIVRANIALKSKDKAIVEKAKTAKTIAIIALALRAFLFIVGLFVAASTSITTTRYR